MRPALEAVLWWERRRIPFNLAVLAAGIVSGLTVLLIGRTALIGKLGGGMWRASLEGSFNGWASRTARPGGAARHGARRAHRRSRQRRQARRCRAPPAPEDEGAHAMTRATRHDAPSVAIYARYSTDRQDARSIDDQVRRCRAFAEARGLDVAGVFKDAAESGAHLERADLRRLFTENALPSLLFPDGPRRRPVAPLPRPREHLADRVPRSRDRARSRRRREHRDVVRLPLAPAFSSARSLS